MTSRRNFLRMTSLGGAAVLAPRMLPARGALGPMRVIGNSGHRPPQAAPVYNDPELRALANRALDAATAAGAQYAEARFTLTRVRDCNDVFDGALHVAIGVRALANGAWGFVASPWWTADEATRIGREAALQAAKNRWYPTSSIDLGPPPPTATGSWSTPVTRDLFEVPVEETEDLMSTINMYVGESVTAFLSYSLAFQRQERTIATTDGAFFTQVIHTGFLGSSFGISLEHELTKRNGASAFRWVTPTGGGYELLERVGNLDELDKLFEDARRDSELKPSPTDVGRYDVLFDGDAMGALIDATIGEPTEVDRVRGFEANAGGTSYLAPAADTLGRRELGTTLLTVRGNRSMPHGAATLAWDDEGVVPDEFDIVRNGIVTDYSTSRQHVATLRSIYEAHNQALRSHGCAGGGTAMNFPLITTPNLVMQPSATAISFSDMVASISNGYAVFGGRWLMDQQGLNGQWSGLGARVYRIRNGRIASNAAGTTFVIRSPNLWKNLAAIGDKTTQLMRGFTKTKGQPDTQYSHSTFAPAAIFRDVNVVDARRKYGA